MEDYNGGSWRDERKFNGLNRHLKIEEENKIPKSREDQGQKRIMDEEMTAEKISELLSDGGEKEEFEQEARELENDTWAAYHLSRELKEHYQETGEYWVLEITNDNIEPVFLVDENKEEIVTHPDYSVDDVELNVELNGEKHDAHPFGILEYTNEKDIFFGKEYRTEQLPVPIVDGEKLEEAELDRINGSYLAPGLADDYREAAEESIERLYSTM